MQSNNEDQSVVAVSYIVEEDHFLAEETPTPVEGVPIESARSDHLSSASTLDFKPEMLAEKLLMSKESEIETLKSQVSTHKEHCEIFKAKSQA